MTERFTFPMTEAGLTLALELTLSLRAAGHRTRTAERLIKGFAVVTVIMTPRTRPTRSERGWTCPWRHDHSDHGEALDQALGGARAMPSSA